MLFSKLTSLALVVLIYNFWGINLVFSQDAGKKEKALIVVTNHSELGDTGKKTGFWLCEATHAYLILERNNFVVDFISPLGGKAPIDERSIEPDNPVNKTFYEKKDAVSKLENTLKVGDINPDDYSIAIFIGGHGALWDFKGNSQLQSVASKVYEKGGIVAGIEQGQAAFLGAKLPDGKLLLEDKDVTAFTDEQEKEMQLDKVVPFSLEEELKKQAAHFTEAPNWQPRIAVTERFITGQNTASMKYLLEQVEEMLKK